jgi:Asp-tRNA(Asn)/Glu-tRNA(Gln) amidotransferase B subunit
MNVYRQGGKFVSKMQKLFIGKAMAECRGNAHPERLQEILKECLEKEK